MRKEFLVERQGKQFVLYAGLLALGHEQGLQSIQTQLLQIPSEANNRVAICSAIIVLEKDGVARTFYGLGDAAPNNVAPAMANATIRLAETRAKARALRDAVNVGMAALAELGDEDGYESAPERGYQTENTRPARASSARTPSPRQESVQENTSAHPITDAQQDALKSLCRRQGILDPDQAAHSRYEVDIAHLTQAQASELIKTLQAETKGTTKRTAA